MSQKREKQEEIIRAWQRGYQDGLKDNELYIPSLLQTAFKLRQHEYEAYLMGYRAGMEDRKRNKK